MKKSILAFGIAKDILGGSAAEIELEENSTIKEFRAALETQYPRFKQLASYMVALNKEYASAEAILKQHDEIAIIPPVSGG